MALRISPLVRPLDLRARSNGALPPELLRGVQDVGQLHHLAARAWTAMRSAAQRDGVALNARIPTKAYRPLADQERIFRDRYRAEGTIQGNQLRAMGRPHKVWLGRRWFQRPNTAVAAAPGTSNHGWGLAVDVDSVNLGGRFRWLDRNAEAFGFSWEIQSEPWHIRYVTAASIPAAVLQFERTSGTVGGTVPPPATTSEEDDMTPEQARQLELVFNALCGGLERSGFDAGSIDLGTPILTTHHLAHLLVAGQDRVADPEQLAEAMVEQLGEELTAQIHLALGQNLRSRGRAVPSG